MVSAEAEAVTEADMVEQVDDVVQAVEQVAAEAVKAEMEVGAAVAPVIIPTVHLWYYPRQRIPAGSVKIVQSIPATLL